MSPFQRGSVRKHAVKPFKKVANATAVLWKLLLVAKRAFRRVKHPELMPELYRGVQYVDGVRVNTEVAAWLFLHVIKTTSCPLVYITPKDSRKRLSPVDLVRAVSKVYYVAGWREVSAHLELSDDRCRA